MTLRAIHPSAISAEEIKDYMAFVIAGGEINAATMPALVTQAISLITIHQRDKLIGKAEIKVPFAGHQNNEFKKTKVADLAPHYAYELGWVVVDSAFRRKGHARALVGHVVDQLGGRAIYATTKSDAMRAILPDFGFVLLGDDYPSHLDPAVGLSLYGRSVP
ncbi:MAG: GNAT family N-acetyltransferase [Sphingomonas sp.]|uniref:GNAT family N-acetyltransferase n=1 Tax=Sphingomonas sp. TaxID=28214 RepID=UPI003F7D7857